MTAVLSCKELRKEYRRNKVLDDVSFELESGQGLFVTGPNGAGKTTLLLILAGLVDATAGSLALDGRRLGPRDHALRRHVGYAPASENSLFLGVSVRKNLEFWAGLHGLEAHARIERMAEIWGFSNYLDRLVREISSGFRRRVALARAFLHEPRLVLLDEPMAFLDNENTQRASQALERWLQERGGVLVVSSNVDFEKGVSWKPLNLRSI